MTEEKALAYAMLEAAFEAITEQTKLAAKSKKDAYEWIFSDEGYITFSECCEAFNFDVQAVRERVVAGLVNPALMTFKSLSEERQKFILSAHSASMRAREIW